MEYWERLIIVRHLTGLPVFKFCPGDEGTTTADYNVSNRRSTLLRDRVANASWSAGGLITGVTGKGWRAQGIFGNRSFQLSPRCYRGLS